MKVVGIDPGVTGAIAMHVGGVLEDVADLPVYDSRIDGGGLHDLYAIWEPDITYVEYTQPMPGNGSIASFSLGMNSGIILGVLQVLQHPFVRVRPTAWKKQMGVLHKDKNAVRGIVRELYPAHAGKFKRVMDHNRAEAVLISRYGVATQLQEANSA